MIHNEIPEELFRGSGIHFEWGIRVILVPYLIDRTLFSLARVQAVGSIVYDPFTWADILVAMYDSFRDDYHTGVIFPQFKLNLVAIGWRFRSVVPQEEAEGRWPDEAETIRLIGVFVRPAYNTCIRHRNIPHYRVELRVNFIVTEQFNKPASPVTMTLQFA